MDRDRDRARTPQFPQFLIEGSDPRERGRAFGSQAREYVRRSIDVYAETFGHYTGLPWQRVRQAALAYGPEIEAFDEPIMREIEGIAQGAGLQVADLLALNARSEVMFGLGVPAPAECTAYFAGPGATAAGHVLLGQNWDWRPRSAGSTVLVEVDQGGERPAFVMLAEAGLVGKIGFNDRGLGVTVNALQSGNDSGEPCVPVHVILRAILDSPDVATAVAAVRRARRGASINVTIADADGEAIALEAAAGGAESIFVVEPERDLLAHSNHFIADVPFVDSGREGHPDTLTRLERMRALLDSELGRLDDDRLKRILGDTERAPNAIYRSADPADHPVEAAATVASLLIDLSTMTLQLAAAPFDADGYESYRPAFAAAMASEGR